LFTNVSDELIVSIFRVEILLVEAKIHSVTTKNIEIDITRVIKSMAIRCDGHVAHMRGARNEMHGRF
jgi:hypothetical protein